MNMAYSITHWQEKVHKLKKEKAKAEAGCAKFRSRYEYLRKEKKTWLDFRANLL